MSIRLRTPAGQICALSLRFNDDGPLGSCFWYICGNGTYIARYDDLATGARGASRRVQRWTCPPTASGCRTGSSSRRSAKAASRTPVWPACSPDTRSSASSKARDRSAEAHQGDHCAGSQSCHITEQVSVGVTEQATPPTSRSLLRAEAHPLKPRAHPDRHVTGARRGAVPCLIAHQARRPTLKCLTGALAQLPG
jgi:Bacterial oxidoreductases, C-terminal